jgi:hypothetical protein
MVLLVEFCKVNSNVSQRKHVWDVEQGGPTTHSSADVAVMSASINVPQSDL